MASSKKDPKPKTATPAAPSAPAKSVSPPPQGFRLFEWKPGNYSLTLRGAGYAWERVARKLAHGEGILERIRFEPEASVFSAFSTDRAALEALQALLDPLLDNEDKLRAIERSARIDGES